MTGTTPVYGIPYPDGATKARNLPAELGAMAAGIEASLLAASIPPVIPAAVMVAASLAARDAYWGVPSTEAERIALQNRGATTLRTDKGWMERYYATYNAATNPGGASPAGWYGATEAVRLRKTSPQSTGDALADTPINWDADTLNGAMWAAGSPSRVTVRRGGLYLVKVNARFDLTSGQYAITRIRDGAGSVAGFSEDLAAGGMPGGGYTVTLDTLRLLPGQYVEAVALTSPGNRPMVPASMSMTVQRIGD